MSIKTQKIIQWIPILQIIPFFYLAKVERKQKISEALKTSLKMGGLIAVINIPRIMLNPYLKSDLLVTALFWIATYFSFLGISMIAISAQERYEHALNAQKEMRESAPMYMSQPSFEAVEEQKESKTFDQPTPKTKKKKKLPMMLKIFIGILAIPIVLIVVVFVFYFIQAVIEGA